VVHTFFDATLQVILPIHFALHEERAFAPLFLLVSLIYFVLSFFLSFFIKYFTCCALLSTFPSKESRAISVDLWSVSPFQSQIKRPVEKISWCSIFVYICQFNETYRKLIFRIWTFTSKIRPMLLWFRCFAILKKFHLNEYFKTELLEQICNKPRCSMF